MQDNKQEFKKQILDKHFQFRLVWVVTVIDVGLVDSRAESDRLGGWFRFWFCSDTPNQGARWRVGCGEDISIWNDTWLPSREHPQILSDIVLGFEDGRVSDLINPSIRTWDENLVHGLFSPEEAAMVLSIPLSRTPVEDKIIWPFTLSGNPQQQNEVWKLIWGLNVPNKVRNFMWRACKEAIPTKHNLLKRKILNEDRCEQCGVESETTAHALWNCSTLDKIWESTPGFED
ncbi:hypothetical protein SO802_014205 [Lithocarpus litseifolius]|uniref:Reverse transcriptase zinc-binding domain-containing protein n=1 Tax=Lithocarpus litseifolius TaxID=425828 RepID=A0AAW2CRH1_9ROSI